MAWSVCGRGCMRSVGHLTTYGPIDSPTFVTPFSFSRLEELDTNELRTSYPILQLQYPPR